MTTALERGEGLASRPGRSLPPRKTRYPLYRRLGGPQCQSGQVWKISPPPGFDPRTVQPVASRYTDYATRLTGFYNRVQKCLLRGTDWVFKKKKQCSLRLQKVKVSVRSLNCMSDVKNKDKFQIIVELIIIYLLKVAKCLLKN